MTTYAAQIHRENTAQWHRYGYNPYDSHSGEEWYAVAQKLGLPL